MEIQKCIVLCNYGTCTCSTACLIKTKSSRQVNVNCMSGVREDALGMVWKGLQAGLEQLRGGVGEGTGWMFNGSKRPT